MRARAPPARSTVRAPPGASRRAPARRASLVDPPPTAPVPPPTTRPAPPTRDAALAHLLALAASTDRGRTATRAERAAADAAAASLERAVSAAASPTVDGGDAAAAAPRDAIAACAGDWILVYSSAQPFRSSPFFWGFQEAMPSLSIAESIFAVTAAAPFTAVGAARHAIRGSTLTSRVRLCVAGLSGDVVTEASLSPTSAANEIVVTPTSTRVEGSPLPIESIAVPAGELLARVRGGSPPAARVRVTACDDAVRVWRTTADDAVYVWVRE